MLNKRYHNPYLYLQRALSKKRLHQTVVTILEQHNEDKAFKMYLAYSANMLNEPISFPDYMNGIKNNSARKQEANSEKHNVANEFMTKKQVKEFVEKSTMELKNFTPPT